MRTAIRWVVAFALLLLFGSQLSIPEAADAQTPYYRTQIQRNPNSNGTYFSRHPKVKAAAIGAGVGAGAGALTGLIAHRGVMRGAMIGAGTGAGVGLIRSSRTLRRHPLMRAVATGGVAGAGLGWAAGRRGGVGKGLLVGSAVGLGIGLLVHGLQ